MKDLVDISTRVSRTNPVNEKAILQAVDNLFEIPLKSMIFNREIGSQIEEVLFEPFNFATKQRLTAIIDTAIRTQIPLAKIKQLELTVNENQRAYEVLLILDIVGVGITETRKTLKSKG